MPWKLTSVYLDRSVAGALERHHPAFVTLEQKQELAAVIHLCGAGAGDAYVRHGMRLTAGQGAAITMPGTMSRE